MPGGLDLAAEAVGTAADAVVAEVPITMASPRTRTTARGIAVLALDPCLTEFDRLTEFGRSSRTFMMPPVGVRQLSTRQSVTGSGQAQRRPDQPCSGQHVLVTRPRSR